MRKILLCFLVILTAVIMASCGENGKITDNDESEVESETLNFKKLTISTLSGTVKRMILSIMKMRMAIL